MTDPYTKRFLLAACAIASLINPYGIAGLLLPLELFSRITPSSRNIYSANISENVPLLSLTGFDASYRAVVIITAVLAVSLFILNRKKLRPAHTLLFAGFLSLAFSASRNVPLYLVIVVPLIGYYAAALNTEDTFSALSLPYQRLLARMSWVFALAVYLVPLVGHAAVVALYPPDRALSPFRFPENIVARLKKNPVSGEMFNDIRYGGYLIWQFYPQKKVFVDTRLIIRPPEFFAEYLAISDRPELFGQMAEKFNITHAILPSALFSRHQKLIAWLYNSGSWRLEYADGAAVLFVRSDIVHGEKIDLSRRSTIAAITDSINSQWQSSPALCRENQWYFSDLLETLNIHHASQSAH